MTSMVLATRTCFVMAVVIAFAQIAFAASQSANTTLSLNEAEFISVQFIALKEPGLLERENFTLIKAVLRDNGLYSRYMFVWVRKDGDVELPDMIGISLDPSSGKVKFYHRIKEPVQVSTSPNLSEEDATRIATDLCGFVPILSESKLMVLPMPDKQRLIWRVRLSGESKNLRIQGATFMIDAHNGEVIAIDFMR